MMTLATICGLLVLLLGAFWWAIRVGKKMNRLEQMEKGQKVVKDLHNFNKEVDEKAKKQLADSDGPVGSPWLRSRN